MPDFLRFDRDGPIVTLTMDEPETRNALTGNRAAEEFCAAAARVAADETIKVVIVTGAGGAFSSGGNVKDMRRLSVGDIGGAAIREEYRQGIQRLALALYNLDAPTIAAVNGPAIGAGCDLACLCDMRIASAKARFAESFIKMGLIAGDGGAWILPRIVGASKAAEMAFTGEAIDAGEALRCGLVSAVVEPEELMAAARDLARRIAVNPAPALRLTKRLMREGQHMRFDSLLELAAAYQALAHKTPEHAEAVAAFIEKRKSRFE